MSHFRSWSFGAKLITIGVVGLLLTFGLCAVGTPFEGHGSPAQNSAAWAGLITFLISLLLLAIGIIALIGRALGIRSGPSNNKES